MKIFVYPPIFQKAYLVAMCLGLSLCLLSKSEAIITVDAINTEYRDNQNDYDAYYTLYDVNKSSANFSAQAFLTTDAPGNSPDVTAYNDGNTTNNSDNQYASDYSSLTLAQAGAFTYNPEVGDENDFVAFYLSANQQGNSDANFYGLNGLQIYTSANATVSSKAEAQTGNLAYEFDSSRTDEGNGTGQLQLFYGSGNSNWDVVLYVPLTAFTLVNNDYQQTYIQFVVDTYTDTAGWDSWQYDANTTLIPEPSGSLLISLGGILGLLSRRRLR
jgi:hypothetical protein